MARVMATTLVSYGHLPIWSGFLSVLQMIHALRKWFQRCQNYSKIIPRH